MPARRQQNLFSGKSAKSPEKVQQLRFLFSLVCIALLYSCKARHSVPVPPASKQQNPAVAPLPGPGFRIKIGAAVPEEVPDLITYAKDFLGIVYSYGGSSLEGMDCSGLVYRVFHKKGIALPRTSRKMAQAGENIVLEKVRAGDLLFFQTIPEKEEISHVGMVLGAVGKNILFIHSTSSSGVIISNLQETYWRDHFSMARRIL